MSAVDPATVCICRPTHRPDDSICRFVPGTVGDYLARIEDRRSVVTGAQADGHDYGDIYLEQLEASAADVPDLVNALRAVLADLESARADFQGSASRTEHESGDYALGRWETQKDAAAILTAITKKVESALGGAK